MTDKRPRIETLEGLRGIAAIVVFLWHCSLGFLPQILGVFSNFPQSQSINGKPWTFIINGPGAVVFFFVLSGFVLTRGALVTNTPKSICNGVIKRWPRLALPTTIATLMSWLLFYFGLYHYKAAAAISHSPWLKNFASASEQPIGHSVWDAITQGLYFTFFYGDQYYDSSMWTMHFEFIASFVIFGMSLMLLLYRHSSVWLSLVPILIAVLLMASVSPWYPPFLVGLVGAFLLPDRLRMNRIVRSTIAILGLYLLGCYQTIGTYKIFSPIPFQYVDTTGALLIIIVCYDINLGPLASRAARFLGDLSFPFYLLHILVLCSVGAALFVWMKEQNINHPSLFAGIVTFSVTVLASLPLVAVNRKWIDILNWGAARLTETSGCGKLDRNWRFGNDV